MYGSRTLAHCRNTLEQNASRPKRTTSEGEPRVKHMCSSRYMTEAMASRRSSLGSFRAAAAARLTRVQNCFIVRHAVASSVSRVARSGSSSGSAVMPYNMKSGYGQYGSRTRSEKNTGLVPLCKAIPMSHLYGLLKGTL